MPATGIPLSPPLHLLTTPELVHLSTLFVKNGVTKIRLTGGEPTVRKDILGLVGRLGMLKEWGLKDLCITTNGISLHRKLPFMVDAGLTGVNLSLDTLSPEKYEHITRRPGLPAVRKALDALLKFVPQVTLKLNVVVLRSLNASEIPDFVELTRDNELEVRFIEYMPFSGNQWTNDKMFTYLEMLSAIRRVHPELTPLPLRKGDTSKRFQIPGFKGSIGFITSMTNSFCGTCNRLRITTDGNIKVCLFGNKEVSLRDVVRKVNGGQPIQEADYQRLLKAGAFEGVDNELVQVVGGAVRDKEKEHVPADELKSGKNRPMILIGG